MIFIKNSKIRVEFEGVCLNPGKISFNHAKVANFYIVYKLNLRPFDFY